MKPNELTKSRAISTNSYQHQESKLFSKMPLYSIPNQSTPTFNFKQPENSRIDSLIKLQGRMTSLPQQIIQILQLSDNKDLKEGQKGSQKIIIEENSPDQPKSVEKYTEVKNNNTVSALISPQNPKDQTFKIQNNKITTLKKSISQLCLLIETKEQDNKFLEQTYQMRVVRETQKIKNELLSANFLIQSKIQRINFLEAQLQKKQSEISKNYYKQTRKHLQLLSQRESQLQSLKKTNTFLKNKISNLQVQNNNLIVSIKTEEVITNKTIQNLKGLVKQLERSLEDEQLERLGLQRKYKQILESIEQIVGQDKQKTKKIHQQEANYQKLKTLFQQKQLESMELIFQIEKLKQQYKQKQDNEIILSYLKENEEIDLDSINKQMSCLVSQLSLLNNKEAILRQYSEVQELVKTMKQSENQHLKALQQKQKYICYLKQKLQEEPQEKEVQKKQPGLFAYLTQKKNQVYKFEQQLNEIYEYIKSKDETINQIISSFQHPQQSTKQEQNKNLNDELAEELKKVNAQLAVEKKLKLNALKSIQYYKEQIIDLTAKPKKGAKKKQNKRCNVCLLTKNTSIFVMKECQHCEKYFHDCDECLKYHLCKGLLNTQQSISMMQFNF